MSCCVKVILFVPVLMSASLADDSAGRILKATLDDEAITPGTVGYLDRALRQANHEQAECLVIVLDTPGGLLTSTRALVKQMLASQVPVVVYVAPQGARAASAGMFITMAAHVAAMAPGTTIGAAHPVRAGGLPVGPKRPSDQPSRNSEHAANERSNGQAAPSTMEEKIVNDTVAWARTLAARRDRNAEWAAAAVEQSRAITGEEAVAKDVVDLAANDLSDLLEKLDGRDVTARDRTRTLNTAGVEVQPVEMWWNERLLAFLSQPNIALLLMMFGFYGILFELYSPGWGIPGTLGAISILLGLFGLSVLPVNYLGLGMIFISLALLAAEIFVTSYGALAIAGTICLVLGGAILIDSPSGFARVSWSVLLPLAGATAVITLLLVRGVVRSHRAPVRTGGQGMVHKTALADHDFTHQDGRFEGMVRIHGERWRAVSDRPLRSGQTCEVEGQDGLTLFVTRKVK